MTNHIERAVQLEVVTIVWTAVAAGIGLIAGTISRSVSLTAFGLDSAVELICAGVLIWRLQSASSASASSTTAESRASRVVGVLLLAAAVYVSIDAVLHLLWNVKPDVSRVGIALTIATIPIMVPLASGKLRIAARIGSRALRADAIGNVVCWYLAAVVLVSLLAQYYFHIAWLDPAASLVIVGLLIVEGIQAVRGDELITSTKTVDD